MGIFRKYVNQTRKPEGFMGKMMIKGMNVVHSKAADRSFSQVHSMEQNSIPDIGCTLRRNDDELLKLYQNEKVTAAGESPPTVEKTE